MPTIPTDHDHARIFEAWHRHARAGDVSSLLALYAPDAILESPLVPAILDGRSDGLLRGTSELRSFLEEGTRRRPTEHVRWYRTGTYFSAGATLIWEYPRATPEGEQIDLVEVMEIDHGRIRHHRIYWGWYGIDLLKRSAIRRALAGAGETVSRGDAGAGGR